MNPPIASALPAMRPPEVPQQTRRYGKAEWEVHRERIVGLYPIPGMKLKAIKELLAQDHDFIVNERQLKNKIDGWKIAKNVQSSEMEFLVQKQARRTLARKPTKFRVRGQPVAPEKIVRWQKRSGYVIEDNMFSIPSTPSDMSYSPASTIVQSPQMAVAMMTSSLDPSDLNMDWVANEDPTLKSLPHYPVMDTPRDNSMGLDEILASHISIFEGQSPAPFTPHPSPKPSPSILSGQTAASSRTEYSLGHQDSEMIDSEMMGHAPLAQREMASSSRFGVAPPTFTDYSSLNHNALGKSGDSEPRKSRYREEEEFKLRQRLNELELRHGFDHPATLDTVSRLADVLQDQGRYGSAEILLKKVAKSCQSSFGEHDLRTIGAYLNLARTYSSQGQDKLAEKLCRNLHSKALIYLPADHSIILGIKNQLGRCIYKLGRDYEAEQILREAIRIGGRTLMPNDPLLTAPMQCLANVLYVRGNYVEAERMTIAILEAEDNETDSKRCYTLRNWSFLGYIYTIQERCQESEELLRQVFASQVNILGKKHRDTLTTHRYLGNVLTRQGKYKESEEILQDALLKLEVSLGKKHPDSLTCRGTLARALNSQRKYNDAELLLRIAVELAEEALGPDHDITCRALWDLGKTHEGQGRLDEALTVSQRAFEGSARMLGRQHLDTVNFRHRVIYLEGLIAHGYKNDLRWITPGTELT